MGTDTHKDVVGVDVHASKEAPNLIENGAFQVWTNGVNSQPDGVSDEGTPTVAQDTGERDNFFDTPYSVKYTATGAANEGGKITISRLKASTSYGLHIRAKATAGDTARIFTTGASINIDQETALTSWTSLYATFTTDATPTDVVIKFVAKADGDIVWFDSLIVVEGDVIPTFAPLIGDTGGLVQSASLPLEITAHDIAIKGLSTVGAANQLPGVNAAGTQWEYKTLSGTANEVEVSHGAGSITLGLPSSVTISQALSVGISGQNTGFQIRKNSGSALEFKLEQYDTDTNSYCKLFLRKSHTTTFGVEATTLDGETLGIINFQGVWGNSVFASGGIISCIGNGSPSGGNVPADVILESYSTGGKNTNQLVLNTDGTLSMSGSLTIESALLLASGSITDSGGSISFGNENLSTTGTLSVTPASNAAIFQNRLDSASNQVVTFKGGNRATPADNDEAYNNFFLDDSTGTQVEFMRETWIATDVTNTTKAGGYQIELMQNNTLRDYMHFSAAVGADTGTIVFNEDSQDIDFRIESNTQTHAFFVQGSNGYFGFHNDSPSTMLHGQNATNAQPRLRLDCTITPDGSKQGATVDLGLVSDNTGKYVIANDILGALNFRGQANDASFVGAAIRSVVITGGNITRSAMATNLELQTMAVGATGASTKMTIDPDGNVGINTASITANQRLDVVFADDTSGAGVTFRNSDGVIQFKNNTGTANVFDPLIVATPKGSGRMFELRGNFDTDSGAFPAVRIRGQFNGGAISTRDVFDVLNHTTSLFTIGVGGEVFMPAVYSDDLFGSTYRDLLIKNDGQLGWDSSSIKYKEHVRYTFDTSWIYDLKPALYDRLNTDVKDEIGLIAEEVNLVNSKMVSFKRVKGAVQKNGKDVYYETDEPETVVKSKLIIPMLKEIQNLKQEIELLKL